MASDQTPTGTRVSIWVRPYIPTASPTTLRLAPSDSAYTEKVGTYTYIAAQ